MSAASNFSNLELVARVDSWPYYQKDPQAYKEHMRNYYYFLIDGYEKPFGYIHSSVVPKVSWGEHWTIDNAQRFVTFHGGDNVQERSRRMEATLRNNLKSEDTSAFDLDGAGVDEFGIINYACHLIAYVKTIDGLKYWVPRRAKTKQSFPNILDNTVGGSLSSGDRPIDCIVRECAEEASLPIEYTKANIRSCGLLSYQMTQTDYNQPGCQHQVQYFYEMEVSEDINLVPNDGEAQEFNLMSLDEVISALRQDKFKLNCGMTWMAFLIRHGHVNAENEPKLEEIVPRLHRKHELFIV